MSQLLITAGNAASSLVATGANSAAQVIASSVANAASAYALSTAQNLIFGPAKRRLEGPRLERLRLQTSTEGASFPIVFGRTRLAGEIIWATHFREEAVTSTNRSGGKGARPAVATTVTEYLYSISFAVGLCAGEIARIGRVWADGKPVNLQEFTWRLYTGSTSQLPDSLIEAVEGIGLAPAYRGLAYIVFEDLPLASFGNRIPQLTFEVERALPVEEASALENAATAVAIIPASGEAAYATTPILVSDGEGRTRPENVHNNIGGTDFVASTRILQETLPQVGHVALIVAWFGTDLRPGLCEIKPGVELTDKMTIPFDWLVNGVVRGDAYQVSQIDEAPAFGGTPSDASVIEAIRHLKAAGWDVMFYPFLLMDIPQGNMLVDPDGETGQPAFPWRGRIRPGLDDKSAAARSGIEALFGNADAGDFIVDGESVIYTGSVEWSLRRMVLHYAHLCTVAGGVSSFLIGSELRGLTTGRDETGAFPAVEALVALASDVRSVLGGGTEVSYAADWSEYFGFQPGDGSGDVLFHLDPLWADSNIDFVGIDNYMPLADWRDGNAHLDVVAGAQSQYDVTYLQGNVSGGEGFDWYYASSADRSAQIRTPITDTAHGEDWVFRYKDIRNWWENLHYERPGGVRATAPTSWQPQSKPVRFTELGCAAVDKAANQPNVFVDPKSAESNLPYFSTGGRDDFAQRRFLEAHLSFWAVPANNPVSSVYGETMLDRDRMYLYTWDARPYPDFPAREDIWADAPNWQSGHWLNGRAGRMPLDMLVKEIAAATGLAQVETEGLDGLVSGYVIDQPMSPRAALEPLAGIYQFDAVERGNVLVFVARGKAPVLDLSRGDVIAQADNDFELVQAQAEDLPAKFNLVYTDETRAYDPGVAEASLPESAHARVVTLDAPVVLEAGEAVGRAASLLADALVMRDQLSFSLPPSQIALEPTDVVTFTTEAGVLDVRLTDILDLSERQVSAINTSREVYSRMHGVYRWDAGIVLPVYGPPVLELMDLPLLTNGAPALYAAGYADPWPGGLAYYEQIEDGTPQFSDILPSPAEIGFLISDLMAGPVAVRDRGSEVQARLSSGMLASASFTDVMSGANLIAIESALGSFELLSFTNAVLQPDGTWTLSGLLRGLYGTEQEASAGANVGARVIVMTGAVAGMVMDADRRGLKVTRLAGPRTETVSGTNFVSRRDAFSGYGWRPMAPVHLDSEKDPGGIALRWIRRTRSGGDSWQGPDVPLAEAQEKYEIDILDGTAIVRTLTVTVPKVIYTQTDIDTDFGPGGVNENASFFVSQISDIYGRGRGASHPLR